MAEVLAAAGSAAAILQLTEYSLRFLKFLKECQAKSTNLPLSFQTILSQHHLLIRSLEILEARAPQDQIDDDLIPHVQSLSNACQKEIVYLDAVLNRIATSGTSSRAKKAIRAIRHEKDIQRSAATLKDCFNTLFTFYQITSIPLPQAPSTDRNLDSNDVESFVTIDGPAQAVQKVQTVLVHTRGDEQHVLQQTILMADRCNCRRREIVQSLKSWSLGTASVSYEFLVQHRSGCPLHARCAKHHRLSFSLRYTSVMLRIMAGVTMSMIYGAGGLSLSPNLTLRGMRREDSPAFRLFDNKKWIGCRTVADATAKINQISLRLQQMFDEGLASPFDLNQKGESLVSAAYYPLFIYNPNWHCRDFTEKLMGLLRLLANSGVPLNDIPGPHRESFYLYSSLVPEYVQELEDEFNPEVIAFLMDRNHEYSNISSHWTKVHAQTHQLEAFLCERNFPDYAELLDCNTLQRAILQRTESQVEDIIKVNPCAVHFQNTMGQSPLHVAVDWPWATALLLKSGADPFQVDLSDCTAIDYACRLENYEVVRILLEAGSPLLADGALRDIMACYSNNYCEQLLKLIISHLAIRRRELLQIARLLLPEATLSSIVPLNEAVPDSSSYQLIEAVCAAGHTTKPEYWLQASAGLYQSCSIFPAAAEVLYQAGFKYLEGRDSLGNTPLSYANTSAMTVWLYRRGASFTEWMAPGDYHGRSAPSMPSTYRAILGLACSIYINGTVYSTLGLRELSEDDFEALNIFLQDDFSELRDLCHCPCCSGGCSPEVIILKTILMLLLKHRNRWSTPSVHLLPRFVQLVDETMVGLYGRLPPSTLIRFGQAAIRMALFLDIGLRHLCCEIIYGVISHPICQEEADEIREEDKFLIEQFVALLPKALSQWKESPGTLAGFWRDFHNANICKRRDGPLDKMESERLRELGVMVHERGDEEIDCDSLYGDGEGYCEEEAEVNDTE